MLVEVLVGLDPGSLKIEELEVLVELDPGSLKIEPEYSSVASTSR